MLVFTANIYIYIYIYTYLFIYFSLQFYLKQFNLFCPLFHFAVLIVVTARGKVDRQHGVLCLAAGISSPRKV